MGNSDLPGGGCATTPSANKRPLFPTVLPLWDDRWTTSPVMKVCLQAIRVSCPSEATSSRAPSQPAIPSLARHGCGVRWYLSKSEQGSDKSSFNRHAHFSTHPAAGLDRIRLTQAVICHPRAGTVARRICRHEMVEYLRIKSGRHFSVMRPPMPSCSPRLLLSKTDNLLK